MGGGFNFHRQFSAPDNLGAERFILDDTPSDGVSVELLAGGQQKFAEIQSAVFEALQSGTAGDTDKFVAKVVCTQMPNDTEGAHVVAQAILANIRT